MMQAMMRAAINIAPKPNVSQIIQNENANPKPDLAVASSSLARIIIAIGVASLLALMRVAVGQAKRQWHRQMALWRTLPKPHVVDLGLQGAAIPVEVDNAARRLHPASRA
jgi:hypothetical protein